MMDDNQSYGSRKQLLLVDDDQFIAVAYKDGMEHAGYEVSVAHNGIEALEKLNEIKPDLIITELVMPKMNGFEFLQKIKKSQTFREIPVLILTNLSQDSDRAEANEYNVSDFLVKSDVSLTDVVNKINELLQ
jgi:two-component system alkaline phosphatase synthesis response regulator PhoP